MQSEFESEKLWQQVSIEIARDDQVAATHEKTILEEAQRKEARDRGTRGDQWLAKHFQLDPATGNWIYKASDSRPWDTNNDVYQYEYNYDILTKTRHSAPGIRSSSILSVDIPNTAVSKPTRSWTLKIIIWFFSLVGVFRLSNRRQDVKNCLSNQKAYHQKFEIARIQMELRFILILVVIGNEMI